jgi:hypothetical protein
MAFGLGSCTRKCPHLANRLLPGDLAPAATSASRQVFLHRQCPVLADQRTIVRSELVIPLEIAEFDSDGLADARQWAKPTRSGRS